MTPGSSRQRLARTLEAAYAEGVLSENTLVHRLELLFDSPLVEPSRLVGDLYTRKQRHRLFSAVDRLKAAGHEFWRQLGMAGASFPPLLALDWEGRHDEFTIGRHPSCDVVLPGAAVSRRHARLVYRDGSWIIQDLGSTNGTLVNGAPVGRCKLQPGDRLVIGDEQLLVD